MPVPRVLVGDSSKAMLAFWEILLESQFDVVGALTDGEGLVAVAKEQAPDLVVLDFSLSFLDGLAIARRLQEAGRTARWCSLPPMKISPMPMRPSTWVPKGTS